MAEQRRNRLSLGAAAALLLAAALVWWLASGRSGPASVDASGSAEAGAGPRVPGLSKPDARMGTRLDLLGAAKAAIAGTIRDPQGNPIPDAQVCATSSAFERRGLLDREPHCVKSGPDGRYAIDGLLPIATEVHGSAPSFAAKRWERRERGKTTVTLPLRAGQTTQDVDITLEPGGVRVRGVIKDIAGGEIEGATVSLVSRQQFRLGASAIARSGADGAFEQWVAPGLLYVHAQAQGYAAGGVEAVAPGEFVELFLTPESVLVGKVVLAQTGAPIEGVEVSARAPAGFGSTVQTDADGRFRIERLEPGTYKPVALSDALYGEASEQVQLGLGQTSEEVVIRVHPAAYLSGRVVIAETHQPCTDGSVRISSTDDRTESRETDDEGRVEFRGVLSGTYELGVSCRGHVSEPHYPDIVVDIGGGEAELGELVWEVHTGLAIRGEVVDQTGEGLASISVWARPVVDPEQARGHTTNASQDSEAGGSFELAGLLPGRYEVGSSSWAGRPGPLEPITVELAPGADIDDLRIVMPAVGAIRGRVIDERGQPVAGVDIRALLIGGQGRDRGQARSNDAGEFELTELRPGSTRVTARSGRYGTPLRKPGTSDDDVQGELVEVRGDELVELVLSVESRDGRITGVVRDSGGGPVADAFIDLDRMSEAAGASVVIARRSVRWSWGDQPVLTDADGRFELDGLPDGKFIVRANRKGGGEALVEGVELGSHIELIIASTGELTGTVTLADGRAPERFTVRVVDKAQGVSVGDSFYRTDGRWRFTELPAGRYALSATAGEGTIELDQPIELGAGELREDVALVLAGRVKLRGRLVDLETGEPVVGVQVSVSGQGRRSFSSGGDDERRNVSGPDGRFELDDVPVGRVELHAFNRAAGSKSKYTMFRQTATIPAEPAEQDLGDLQLIATRLEPNHSAGDLGFALNRWDPTTELDQWKPTVASIRPGGPAEGSGLAPGDVIVKLDGHDVSGTHGSRYAVLSRVPEGTTITLEIDGGKTVQISAGPPVF